MPYILNKTDGSVVAVVQDASLDLTTDLTFLGRNYAGYGEVQNENFLKLLENFSNTSSPGKPIEGQLWFDKNFDNKKLNVFDGKTWKSIANLEVASDDPTQRVNPKDPKPGDLWYNTAASQLYVFNGFQYNLIGPSVGADTQAGWRGDTDSDVTQGEVRNYNIKAVIGATNEVVAIVSPSTYQTPSTPAAFTKYTANYNDYAKIYRGITLAGANPDTGISWTAGTGSILWGTAAHSLRSASADSALKITTAAVPNTNVYYVPFVGAVAGSSSPLAHTGLTYSTVSGGTLTTTIFSGTATRARYADLAERYEADSKYEPGTVVVIGGEKEITVSSTRADTRVAGIISEKPAYMMNSEAGSDETHPYVALKGRVYCKVTGTINKGDMLVTSNMSGHAEVWQEGDSQNAVFARALENFSGASGLIEVKV